MTRTLLPLLLLLGCLAAAAEGQELRVGVEEENFRAAPGGLVLGVLRSGTPLGAGERRGRWREVTLEGWIWTASVTTARAAGYDLQVSVSGGENLRAEPSGEILGRLATGTLLERLEARGRWLRVRRTGWLWAASLEGDADAAREQAEVPPAAPAAVDSTAVAADTLPAPGPEAAPTLRPRMRPGRAPAALRATPGGDSLGSLRAAAEVEVLRTEDGWARVRLEGWVPLAELEEVPGGAVLRGLTRAELAADPDRYRGRLVEWQLRFISLERAEAGRSEFGAGERYLLMRGPGAAPGFVYVAVADDALPRVRALVPLQAVRVLARVRMARSPLTGVPVLELLELEPIPGN